MSHDAVRAQHPHLLPCAAADNVAFAHVALQHLVARNPSPMCYLRPAAAADDSDDGAGLEARFRYPAVQSSGAAEGFKLFSLLNDDYVMDDEHFAGDASTRPVYRCMSACLVRDGGSRPE